MSVEINQLRYFQVVAKHQHMTRAANELHISQSSLSKTIAALERDVGTNLFDRIGGGIVLNAVGKRFLERVDRSLLELEEAVQEANAADSGQVTFAVANASICASYMYSFICQHPNICLHHYPMPYKRVRESLETGELDFALTYDSMVSDRIAWDVLGEEEVLLIVPADHPAVAAGSADLRDFRNEKFIFNNSDFGISEFGNAFCRQAGFEPKLLFEGDEPKMGLKLAAAGLGVMFMSALEYTWHTVPANPESPFSGVRALHIREPVCRRTVGLAYLKNQYMSPSVNLFLDGLKQFFRDGSV